MSAKLGRSLAELVTTVTMLKERRITRLSLKQNRATSSDAGELVLHVFAGIAYFERRLNAGRTKDQAAVTTARGNRPGPQPLDPDRFAAALKVVAAGFSPTATARELGPGRSTVYRGVNRADLPRRQPIAWDGGREEHWSGPIKLTSAGNDMIDHKQSAPSSFLKGPFAIVALYHLILSAC